MPIQRLGLVVHGGRADAVAAAETVRTWCTEHNVPCHDIDVWSDREPRHSGREEAAAAGHPDLVLTLGGDGTFLRGARVAVRDGARVLGVDFGHVGFLTEVPGDQVRSALDAVHRDETHVERRMTLTLRTNRMLTLPQGMEPLVRLGRGPTLPTPAPMPPEEDSGDGWGMALDVAAINDVVLEKLVRDRQIALAVYVSGQLLASYSADAAIIATATGSTAYSFAAGGPILSPRVNALVFTPVAPHMAFDRTVVAGPDEPIAARVLPHSGPVAVSIDGQLRGVLEPGDWAGVYPAGTSLCVVRLGATDFYTRLRDRFSLPDAPATRAAGAPPDTFPPPTPDIPDDLRGMQLPPPFTGG